MSGEVADTGELTLSDITIARSIVEAVRRIPGVVDFGTGRYAEAATYGRGERVRGVSLTRMAGSLVVTVHLCVAYSDSLVLPELAATVRSVVGELIVDSLRVGPLQRVDVVFDDINV